jgi:beta-glucosidase
MDPSNSPKLDLPKFPSGFLWGASTSAHQVEGGNYNDWSEWEKENADKLAKTAASKFAHWLPGWEEIKAQAQSPSNYLSDGAADHYNLYEQDFDLMKEIGLNAYRFSIEWSRIEPQYGTFNYKVVDHYKRVIEALKVRGIEPMITLWHWTLPLWFRDLGGWENMDAARYFSDFVNKIVGSCKDVTFWITLNEPEVYARQSYLVGDWPPQKRSLRPYLAVINNLALAHNYVVEGLKQIHPGSQVGIAQNNVYLEAAPANIINKLAVIPLNYWWNEYFLNRINSHLDFIGLNYYFHRKVNFTPYLSRPTKSLPQSDLGWQLHTEGLYHTLMGLKMYKKPVYITEHGLADAKDTLREWYLIESLTQAKRAMDEGLDLRGYMHWSLLDNFEWDKGFWPRFGLIEVDFKTQKRTIRKSAYTLKKIIESR